MQKVLVFILFSLTFIIGCDKRIMKYTEINLLNIEEEPSALYQLEFQFKVFTFLSPECPLSENYTRTLLDLQEQFLSEDVDFYYVFPGTFYPRPQIEVFMDRYNLPLDRLLYDPEYHFKDYCNANTTPEVFLIDDMGVILYKGAIDNWAITLGKQRQIISEHYLVDALNDVISGKKVMLAKTRAVGCIIE